jgi:hypothetical protein
MDEKKGCGSGAHYVIVAGRIPKLAGAKPNQESKHGQPLHDNSLVKGHRPSTPRIDRIISCSYAVTLCDCVLRRNNAVPKRVADVLLQWADLSLFKLRLFLSFAHRLKCKS